MSFKLNKQGTDLDEKAFFKTSLGVVVVVLLVNLLFWGGLVAAAVWAASKWIVPLF